MNAIIENVLLHLIESSILAGLLYSFASRFSKSHPTTVCWIYLLALLKFLVPSIVFVSWFRMDGSENLLTFIPNLTEPIHEISQSPPARPIGLYFLIFWGIGVSIFGVRSLSSAFKFSRAFRFSISPLYPREQSIFAAAKKSLNKPVDSIRAELCSSGPPIGLYGIFRPRIIAKHEFLEMLNDNELLTAFKHEIAHKIRGDNVWLLIADIVLALMWFNPVVWLLRRELAISTEKACDKWVLATENASNDYARCLLKAAEFSSDRNYFYSVALSETSLKARVSNIIYYKKEKSIVKPIAIITSALMLFAGSITLMAGAQTKAPEDTYSLHELEVKPKPIKMVNPVYPPELKKKGKEAKVILSFIVEEDGSVSHVKALNTDNVPRPFVDSAAEAVIEWTFSPGQKDGSAVRTRVKMPMAFTLKPKK